MKQQCLCLDLRTAFIILRFSSLRIGRVERLWCIWRSPSPGWSNLFASWTSLFVSSCLSWEIYLCRFRKWLESDCFVSVAAKKSLRAIEFTFCCSSRIVFCCDCKFSLVNSASLRMLKKQKPHEFAKGNYFSCIIWIGLTRSVDRLVNESFSNGLALSYRKQSSRSFGCLD